MATRLRQPYSYEEIDTASPPSGERFAPWRDGWSLPMEVDPPNDRGFEKSRIRVRRLSGPSGRFVDLRATPMTLHRSKNHCHRDGLDMIGLTLMVECGIEHHFAPSEPSRIIGPGQILLKDFTEPAVARWTSNIHRGLNLHLPRASVEAALGGKIGRLHGAVLSPGGLFPLLKMQMETLAEIMPGLRPAARVEALESTVTLAASVLRVEFGAHPEADENTGGLFAAARAFIDRHLTSHDLQPEMIARQIGCSRAHLYRVFKANGSTIAEYVRSARLRRAYGFLTPRVENNTSIGDIAFGCGFEDPVHFTRLFRLEFGVTPSELRSGGERLHPVASK